MDGFELIGLEVLVAALLTLAVSIVLALTITAWELLDKMRKSK